MEVHTYNTLVQPLYWKKEMLILYSFFGLGHNFKIYCNLAASFNLGETLQNLRIEFAYGKCEAFVMQSFDDADWESSIPTSA